MTLGTINALVDSVDQDQAAQDVQPDLDLHCPLGETL